MASCAICGRALTSPASMAKGVGPICGGRFYMGRIMNRFGHSGYGWSTHAEWEKVNEPCYSCAHFTIPGKGEEVKKGKERIVTMKNRTKAFDLNAIGGYCSALKQLVDGNTISEKTACEGTGYVARKPDEEQPEVGLLHLGGGQYELFQF